MRLGEISSLKLQNSDQKFTRSLALDKNTTLYYKKLKNKCFRYYIERKNLSFICRNNWAGEIFIRKNAQALIETETMLKITFLNSKSTL